MTSHRSAETTSRDLTVAMEDAVAALYRLQETTDDRVSTSELAAALDVEPPTVSSMFSKLADRGLIDREPHRPVALTDAGTEVALDILRKHRLAETMLCEMFEYRLSEVDAEADVLEHYLSDELCRAIERKLNDPNTDPHGDPIPNVDLEIRSVENWAPLVDVPARSRAEVCRIRTRDDDVMEYLVSRGVEPSARLHVEETSSIGVVSVTVSETGDQVSLPEEIAGKILVTLEDMKE
jgi:DtxR family Mn-dependent transcriptional regulator